MNNPLVIDVSGKSEVTFWCYVVEGDEVTISATPVDADQSYFVHGQSDFGLDFSTNESCISGKTGYYQLTLNEFSNVSKVTVTFPREQNVSTEVDYSGGDGCELIASTVNVAVAALPLYPTRVDVADDMELSDLVIVKSGATIDGTTDVTLYATSVTHAYSMFYSSENYSKTTGDDGSEVLVATGKPDAYVIGAQFDDGQEIGAVSLSRYSASSDDKGTWSVGENNIGDNQSMDERDVTVSNSAGVKAYFTQGAGNWVNGAGMWGKITAVAGYGGEATLEEREEMSPVRRIVVDCNCWAVDITVEVGYIDTSPDCWNGRDPEFCETPTVSVERVDLCDEGSVCNDTGAEKVVVEGWNSGYSGERATIVAKANPDVEAPEETESEKLAAKGGNTASPVAVEGGTMYPGTGGLYHHADNISEYKTFDRYQYGVLVGGSGVVPLPCELSGTGYNLKKKSTKVALVTEDVDGGIWLYEGWQAACFQDGITVSVSRVSATLSILTITGEGNWTGAQRPFTVYVRPTEQDVWCALTVVQDSPGSGLILFSKGWSVDAAVHDLSSSRLVGWYGFSSDATWTVEYMSADEVKEELGLDYGDEYGDDPGVEFSTEDNGDGSGWVKIDSIKISANEDTKLCRYWYFRVSCDEEPAFSGENVCYFSVEQAMNVITYSNAWESSDSNSATSIYTNRHISDGETPTAYTEYTSDSFDIDITVMKEESAHPTAGKQVVTTATYKVPAVIYPERTLWTADVVVGGYSVVLEFIREASNYSVDSTEVTTFLQDAPEIVDPEWFAGIGCLPAGEQWHEGSPYSRTTITATGWFVHHYQYADGTKDHPKDSFLYVGDPNVRWTVSGETYSGDVIDVSDGTDTAFSNAGVNVAENGSNQDASVYYPLEFSTTLGLPLYEEYCDVETRTGAWAEFSTTLGEFTGGMLPEGFLAGRTEGTSFDDTDNGNFDYSDFGGPGSICLWPSKEACPTYVYSPIKVVYTWAPSWYLRFENDVVNVPSAGGSGTNPILRDWKPNYPDDETVVTDTYWTDSYTIEPNTDEATKTYTRVFAGSDTGRTIDLAYTIIQAGAGVVYSLESST
ncbi:MAG: hypothetical protein LUD52_02775, partial [Opitutae bacterium]|nr:hypothetical protein [Opitutae bacterium]